jgi:hypothetical protein
MTMRKASGSATETSCPRDRAARTRRLVEYNVAFRDRTRRRIGSWAGPATRGGTGGQGYASPERMQPGRRLTTGCRRYDGWSGCRRRVANAGTKLRKKNGSKGESTKPKVSTLRHGSCGGSEKMNLRIGNVSMSHAERENGWTTQNGLRSTVTTSSRWLTCRAQSATLADRAMTKR